MMPMWQQIAMVAILGLSALGVWQIFAICRKVDVKAKAEIDEAARRIRAGAAYEKWDRGQRGLTGGSEQGL